MSEATNNGYTSDSSSAVLFALGIVIIANNQADTITKILASLAAQVHAYDHIVVVIASQDDCASYNAAVVAASKLSISIAVQYANHGVTGFNAGANRDQGTNYLLGQYADLVGVIYIDGDCIPSTDTVASFRALFIQANDSSMPVVGCGARVEQNTSTNIKSYDCRINNVIYGRSVFTPGMNRVVLHDRHLRSARVCWSCNCGLNTRAIQLLRKTNSALFDDESRAWASIWDGNYGNEDTFVGLTVFRAGGLVVAMDPTVTYVMHQPHPSLARNQAAVTTNKQKFDSANAQLSRHFQCGHSCAVLLHVRAYDSGSNSTSMLQAGPTSYIYDTPEFYNNILSIDIKFPGIEHAVVKLLKIDTQDTVSTQVALFLAARTLSVAYGSGATLQDKLDKELSTPNVCYRANYIWRKLLALCVSAHDFLEVVNRLQETCTVASTQSTQSTKELTTEAICEEDAETEYADW